MDFPTCFIQGVFLYVGPLVPVARMIKKQPAWENDDRKNEARVKREAPIQR